MAALAAESETATLEQPAGEPVAASPSPRAPEAGGAGAAKKPAKGEKGAKTKKKESEEAVDPGTPSIAAHPRAVRSVDRVKAWGGLVGFFVGGYLSLPTHTLADAGLRALVAGMLCYVAAWAGAVFVWRRLVALEIKAREQELMATYAVEPPEAI